ncbi:MAG: class I SAM-dependent methyltransferase [Desulfurococcales archaeon]|nr:class I SAM-dependent methyltransferase [Desulfurococcales archaeon]
MSLIEKKDKSGSNIIEDIIEKIEYSDCTYPPSDDSLLGISLILELAKRQYKFSKVLDLCTGTGVLALAAHRLLDPDLLVAVDISPYAVEDAKRNLPGNVLVIRCNLAECTRGTWDLVIVNPPYLPFTDDVDNCDGFLVNTWRDTGVLRRACLQSANIADSVLFIYSSLSPLDVEECLSSRGFNIKLKLARGFFMEKIYAVYAERTFRET